MAPAQVRCWLCGEGGARVGGGHWQRPPYALFLCRWPAAQHHAGCGPRRVQHLASSAQWNHDSHRPPPAVLVCRASIAPSTT